MAGLGYNTHHHHHYYHHKNNELYFIFILLYFNFNLRLGFNVISYTNCYILHDTVTCHTKGHKMFWNNDIILHINSM